MTHIVSTTIIFIIIIIIIISILFVAVTCGVSSNLRSTTTENFDEYIREIYNPTQLERTPLTLYLDESDSYINMKYIKNIFDSYTPGENIISPIKIEPTPIEKLIGKRLQKKIPIEYVVSTQSESDLILIPEFNAKKRVGKNFKYLSKMTELKFAYIYVDKNNIVNMRNFFDIENISICMKNGYTKNIYNELYKNLNVFPKKITYYDDEKEVTKLLQTGICDAVAILMLHPNIYLKELSNKIALKIVGWGSNEPRFEDLKKQMSISKSTLSLKFYNFVNFKESLKTHSIDLNLYVKSSLNDKIVFDLTELTYRPNGVLRSYALNAIGEEFVETHPGTKRWLIENGLLSIGSVTKPEPESCRLLAGKSVCSGRAAEIAEKKFQDMKIFNDELGDNEEDEFGLDAIPFIENAKKNKDHPEFGNVYKSVLEQHGKYLSM